MDFYAITLSLTRRNIGAVLRTAIVRTMSRARLDQTISEHVRRVPSCPLKDARASTPPSRILSSVRSSSWHTVGVLDERSVRRWYRFHDFFQKSFCPLCSHRYSDIVKNEDDDRVNLGVTLLNAIGNRRNPASRVEERRYSRTVSSSTTKIR